MRLNSSNLVFVREPHDQGPLYSSSLRFVTSVLRRQASHKHYSRRAWSCSARCSKDNIDSSQRGSWRSLSLRPRIGLSTQPARMMQQLLQFALSDKLVQVVPQTPAILCYMAMIPMILTIEVTVSLFGISYHLVGPFKEWFILDFF